MTNHFCEQVIAPGIVLFLKHQTDLSLSTWGVSVPYDYWRGSSKLDIIARFEEYSSGNYPQIPYVEFTSGEEWKLRFGSLLTTIVPLCWIDDFLPGARKAVPVTLWVSSRRDGARYYRELLKYLEMLARDSSRDFTQEEISKEQIATQKFILHAQAIRTWQLENPDWRGWKTVYEPGHPLHFDLF